MDGLSDDDHNDHDDGDDHNDSDGIRILESCYSLILKTET